LRNSNYKGSTTVRTLTAALTLVLWTTLAFSQSGRPFPNISIGGTLTHNGWELTATQLSDVSNTNNPNATELLLVRDSNSVVLMDLTVDYNYANGPSATVHYTAPGASLVVGYPGHSYGYYFGTEVSPPESSWSLNGAVQISEIRYWTAAYAVKLVEDTPYEQSIQYFPIYTRSMVLTIGRYNIFTITDEPDMW
jgi:hypothetical protein